MNSVKNILQPGLVKNTGKISQLKNYRKNKEVNAILQNEFDAIIIQEYEYKKLSKKK